MRSSSLFTGIVLALSLLTLGACTRYAQPPGADRVGFVRMSDLIKKHPLYSQLSNLDDSIAALQLRSTGGSQIVASGADVQRETALLQKQLDVAANRARAELKQKQDDYQRRENDAVRAVVAAAGGAAGAGAGAIAGQMQTTASDQANGAAQQAQANMTAFQSQTIAQEKAAVSAAGRSLSERADRTYRAKAEELHERESSYALQQANADAPQRLALRTKLSNLPLDDSSRKQITDQLDAIDRKEADGLAAMRNRDQATLAALQTQLSQQTRDDFRKQQLAIHDRSTAKLADRANQTQTAIVQQLHGTISTTATAPGAARLSPEMQSKLLALHKKYQADFQKDAGQTIKDFMKTKEDLSRRFAQLHGVDIDAQGDAQRKLAALQKQREDLYDSIVAQIGREVKLVAERRSVGVVVSDVVAPVGVDLTDDAEKDIESLHE